MRKFPKTDSPEVLCLSSMGNEPGLQTSCRELTPAARARLRREVDGTTDKNKKRQLLRSAAPGMAQMPVMSKATAQVSQMRQAAKKPII